ncbi:MAG: YdcF family protein [Proteobacteria bacterium]|nr:YdcF family protein [Pseudomonadota bacterium]
MTMTPVRMEAALSGMTHNQAAPAARPRRAWRILRPGFLFPAFLASLVLGLFGGFLSFADEVTRPYDPSSPRTEAIVAMTGGSYRVSDAVGLLGSGHGRRLLVSGVNPMVREREFARAVPAALPFLGCCIDLDHRALNTRGNAIETAKWARLHAFRSLLVVTSSYHMPRTMLELQHLLPDVQLVAYPVQTDALNPTGWWKDRASVKILGFEYAKYLLAAVGLRLDAPIDERPRPMPMRTARN